MSQEERQQTMGLRNTDVWAEDILLDFDPLEYGTHGRTL